MGRGDYVLGGALLFLSFSLICRSASSCNEIHGPLPGPQIGKGVPRRAPAQNTACIMAETEWNIWGYWFFLPVVPNLRNGSHILMVERHQQRTNSLYSIDLPSRFKSATLQRGCIFPQAARHFITPTRKEGSERGKRERNNVAIEPHW